MRNIYQVMLRMAEKGTGADIDLQFFSSRRVHG